MSIFTNKIFLILLIIIFSLLTYQFVVIASTYKVDHNTYVTLIQWMGTLDQWQWKKVLKIDEKVQIFPWNIVTTVKKDSLAVIEWGDKSITRLSGNTRVLIKENTINDESGNIFINFELLKGKTWSQVISTIKEWSYFKQEMRQVTAAARGTAFEANYEQEIFAVYDHEVEVKGSSTGSIIVSVGEAFSLKSWKIEDLKSYVDTSWVKMNEEMDAVHLQEIRQAFLNHIMGDNVLKRIYFYFYSLFHKEFALMKSFLDGESSEEIKSSISHLSDEDRSALVGKFYTLAQGLNAEKWQDPALYQSKLSVRQFLIDETQSETDKEILVKQSMYDVSDMFSSDMLKSWPVSDTLKFLETNKALIQKANYHWKSFGEYKDLLKKLVLSQSEALAPDKIVETLQSRKSQSEEKIFKWLDKLLELYRNK